MTPRQIYQLIKNCDDEKIGILQLQNDPLYDKIPGMLCSDIVKCTLKIGEYVADFFRKRGLNDPIQILKFFNIKIIFKEEGKFVEGKFFFSEYMRNPPTIIIYLKPIKTLYTIMKGNHLQDMINIRTIIQVFLAHEIFHHIEMDNLCEPRKIFRIVIFKLGNFKITSYISSVSEIAAYQFAKSLLNLKFPPAILSLLISLKR